MVLDTKALNANFNSFFFLPYFLPLQTAKLHAYEGCGPFKSHSITHKCVCQEETACNCDGNNTFHLLCHQINVNLCPLSFSPVLCSSSRPFSFCLASLLAISPRLHFYLMHWVTGYLAESSNICTAKGEGGAERVATADEIWAVITLTISCQSHCSNLRVHQFSEEEIKGEEEKQSR